MSKRILHAIYCDDIRHEVSGKLSLIGCYSGEMYVMSFPIVLPKLCVHFSITTPHDAPFSGPMAVTVMQDEATLVKMDLDASWTKSFPSTLAHGRESYVFVGGIEISPANLQGPTTIRIVADCGGEILHGPKLWVMERPQQAGDSPV